VTLAILFYGHRDAAAAGSGGAAEKKVVDRFLEYLILEEIKRRSYEANT